MSKTLQVRDLPDDVHRRLKLRALEEGRSMSDYVREQLTEIASRPTLAEIYARIDASPAVDIPESAADAIRDGRDGR